MNKRIDKKIITFSILLATTCMIFIPFLIGHYATDTYNIANVGYKTYAINWSLNDGRFIMALIVFFAHFTKIPIEIFVTTTLFFALVISDISVLKICDIVKKYKEPKNIYQEMFLIIISFVTVFNFMYLENMYFVESIVMALSVLLFIVSADILVEKKDNYIIKSLLLTILGIICYQGTIGLFFAFTVLLTILKNKEDVKQIIIDLIKSGLIAFVAVILNIVSVKIIGGIIGTEQTRLGGVSGIFNNICMIIKSIPDILQNTCNLFPKNLLIFYLIVLTGIIILLEKENKNIICKYLIILFVTIAASYTTYILTLTSFYTGRLRNALGALIGIVFILLYVCTNVFENKKTINIIALITLLSYLVITIINSESIMLQHKWVNRLEQKEVSEINSYIEKYEKEKNTKITKIVKVPIKNNLDKTYFEGTKNKTSFTHDATKTSWAADGVINFYTNRDLKTEKELIPNLDKNRDYECVDDTLYVKVYMF